MEGNVSLVTLIEYADASAEVKAVYDDIMRTRGVDWVNNFWKALANDPAQLRRIWDNVKQVMAPGALDPLVKEMIYVAVSATNGCEYCTYSHTAAARKKGMTEPMFMELMAVVGLANETNHRHKLHEHGLCHAFLARGGGVRIGAVFAAVGSADRHVDHFLDQ